MSQRLHIRQGRRPFWDEPTRVPTSKRVEAKRGRREVKSSCCRFPDCDVTKMKIRTLRRKLWSVSSSSLVWAKRLRIFLCLFFQKYFENKNELRKLRRNGRWRISKYIFLFFFSLALSVQRTKRIRRRLGIETSFAAATATETTTARVRSSLTVNVYVGGDGLSQLSAQARPPPSAITASAVEKGGIKRGERKTFFKLSWLLNVWERKPCITLLCGGGGADSRSR